MIDIKIEIEISKMNKEELRELNDLIKERWNEIDRVGVSKFRVGEQVSFFNKSSRTTISGKVIRLNQKSVTLDCGNKQQWKVSPGLLKKEPFNVSK